MNNILDFQKNQVEIISLDELKRSVDESSTGNKPFNGIRHYCLWDSVLNLLEKRNIRYDLDKITATDNKNRIQPGVSIIPIMEDQYGKGSIESHLLRRVIGKISLPDFGNEKNGSGIAINFHQAGIEIAIGMHVFICSNLNIYGDTYIRSYGQDSIPLQNMLEIVSEWLFRLSDFRMTDVRITESLQETILDPSTAIPALVGKLSLMAVRAAYIDSRFIAPLNIGQTSTFSKNLLKEHIDTNPDYITAWDLLNLATDLIKPGKMNAQEVLVQSHAVGKFFTKEYLPQEILNIKATTY